LSISSTHNAPPSGFAALKIKEFRHFITGRFIYIMGLRMVGTLVAWWLYELTRDPLAMGLVGLAEVIPAVSLALYAGHVIDKSEKRSLLLTTMLLYLGCALALCLLSAPWAGKMMGKNWIVYSIYAVIFLTGAIRAFAGSTFHAILAYIVPKALLPNAATWNSGTWLAASVAGHALAGFCIAYTGIHRTTYFFVAMIAVAIVFMWRLQPRPPAAAAGEKRTWESVKEGLQFVLKTKEILGALTLDLFAVLFGGAVAMVPVFAKDILHIGPVGFGWLNAASDIGSICIVLFLTFFPLRKQQGKILLLAVAGFGICIIAFGLSNWFWLSFLALLFSGLLDGISVVIRGTILQLKTPVEMRGRVMSVNSMFINSSNELGQFESGVAAKLMGIVPSVVFGGCMTIGIALFTWFKAPNLRKMEY
jgi:MFS family permease